MNNHVGPNHVGHLIRRFTGSLSRRPPDAGDTRWVAAQLTSGELALWVRLSAADQRHSILVARRFIERYPIATRPEIAGALLHDVGKLDAGLGTFGRVVATVVGPRTDRFRRYHDHESLGAAMLAQAESEPLTVSLVLRIGPGSAALEDADDI
ncbi:MAG: hypothetical protein WCO88_06695 [Actinomycetota bacterium]